MSSPTTRKLKFALVCYTIVSIGAIYCSYSFVIEKFTKSTTEPRPHFDLENNNTTSVHIENLFVFMLSDKIF